MAATRLPEKTEQLLKRIENALREVIDASPPPAHVRHEVIDQQQREVVAACLIGEAGGETMQGMQAVMNVIANRAQHDPKKFIATVLQRKQFSMFNVAQGLKGPNMDEVRKVVDRCKKHPLWNQALMLVSKAAMDQLPDLTKGALYYYAPARMAKPPYWAKSMKQTVRIGGHLFLTV